MSYAVSQTNCVSFPDPKPGTSSAAICHSPKSPNSHQDHCRALCYTRHSYQRNVRNDGEAPHTYLDCRLPLSAAWRRAAKIPRRATAERAVVYIVVVRDGGGRWSRELGRHFGGYMRDTGTMTSFPAPTHAPSTFKYRTQLHRGRKIRSRLRFCCVVSHERLEPGGFTNFGDRLDVRKPIEGSLLEVNGIILLEREAQRKQAETHGVKQKQL